MRLWLFLLLAAPLGATPPQARILSASLVIGPGREPRAGSAPFHPDLRVEVSVDGLRKGEHPAFGLWKGPAAGAERPRRLARIRVAAMVPEGPGRYRLLATPEDGTGGTLILRLWLRGRWGARVEAPILRMALPAARPRGGQEE